MNQKVSQGHRLLLISRSRTENKSMYGVVVLTRHAETRPDDRHQKQLNKNSQRDPRTKIRSTYTGDNKTSELGGRLRNGRAGREERAREKGKGEGGGSGEEEKNCGTTGYNTVRSRTKNGGYVSRPNSQCSWIIVSSLVGVRGGRV